MACGGRSSFEGISMASKPGRLCSLTLSMDKFLILVCTSDSTGVLQVEMAVCKTLILFKEPREEHVSKLLQVIEEHKDVDKMVLYDTEDVQDLHYISGPRPSNCKMITTPGVGKETIEFGFMSPKLDELVQIFRLARLSKEVLLISVERNIGVQVIEQLMNVMNKSSQFSILYVTGGSSLIDALLSDGETEMPTIKDLFLSEKVTLFTTNVTEEVACIPSFSFILHKLPISVCSYVETSNQVQNEHANYVHMPERYFILLFSQEIIGFSKLLPSESFHRLKGTVSMNCNRIQSVSLNVHKGLHEVGAVKGHALHSFEDTWENDFVKRTNEYYSGAGTTKRKELHGMTAVRALSGTWASQADDVILNTYEIKFICNLVSGNYSPFVLLTEERLDDDVANTEIELHLHLNKMVRSSVSPCGQILLNAGQVAKSKLFHEFFFNGLFGKLFSHTKTPREFLLGDDKQFPWSSSYVYLLLPMESPFPTSTGIVSINWKEIDACISVVEFLRNIYSINCQRSSLTCTTSSYATKCEGTNIVHLANEAVYSQFIKGMVVLAVHTGRIYTVLDIMNNMCADSPFDENPGKQSKFNSFSHYFHQKYNIVLQHPGQPLLLVKQSHHPYNLLVSSTKHKVADGSISSSERSNIRVHIPPELLVHLNVSSNVLRSSYLLPSVMNRLESMMLACQLRQETCCIYGNHSISCSLILEAITTSRCSDNFSMERLELLGDSVLKYIVSCHLVLKYPMKSEGQLSEYRSWIVSNSTLHKLGIHRYLQGYIRDCPFDPRRWVAPGQIPLRPLPCTCGVDTSEVPLEKAYWSEEASTVVGKACDKGHRWICSKTIADCVEALIGAYYVGGGLSAALSLLRWLGMDVSPDSVMIEQAKLNTSVWLHHLRGNEIDWLESKLIYRFSNKGLLLEAITHPSHQGVGNKYCYQRLEFLGDSVLGLLITWYLFQTYVDLDPGELSDLRSALVSNENFAQAIMRHGFEKHLWHASGWLSKKIREHRNYLSEFQGTGDSITSFAMAKAPKALGDLLESIAGAVLIDTDLSLDRVWEVFKPLLSPMVTPDELELPPLRELVELCNHMGYPLQTQFTYKGEQVVAELSIQLEDDLLVRHGCNLQRKTAKSQAALQLLQDLETRGISRSQYSSKRRQQAHNICSTSSIKISMPHKYMEIVRTNLQNVPGCLLSLKPSTGSFLEESCQLNDLVKEIDTSKLNEPDVPVLSMKKEKGGPRNCLFELCAASKWPMPKFESTEQKFRTPILLDGVKGFNSYTSSITLHIPYSGAINLVGEPRTNKKSSWDSAAFTMLVELQKQGRCIIKEL